MIYLLFRADQYQVVGGMDDCAGVFRTSDEAISRDAYLRDEQCDPADWAEVVEINPETLEYKEVASRGGDFKEWQIEESKACHWPSP